MPPLFCTLSLGRPYWRFAKYLADDLADLGYQLLVVTDGPHDFRRHKNVIVREFHAPAFHHNLKCHAYRAAIAASESIIYVDADTVISETLPLAEIHRAVRTEFPPGLHTWKNFPREEYPYPKMEEFARSWGLKFDPDNITYQERIVGLRRDGHERQFLDLWERFGEEIFRRFKFYSGDGTAMAICAQSAGVACHAHACLGRTALAQAFIPMRHRYPLGLNLRPLRKLRARLRGQWP